MSEKPTPGPWFECREGFSTVYVEARIGGGMLQEVAACGPTQAGQDQQTANARLIAEAGTVYHEYGLTPRELAEQRDAFIAACRKMIEWDEREKDHSIDFYARMDLCDEAFKLMRAALANTERKTSSQST